MWYTKLIYVILLIIGLLFSILYDGIFSMLLFGVLLLLPLTQFCLVHHVRRRLSVTLQVKQTEVGRNSPQQLYCTLQNKSRLPLNYCHTTLELKNETAGETEQLELQLPLQGNFAATVSFQFTSLHCGKLHIHVKSCRVMDYLHLFSCSVRKHTAADCVVIPSEQADGLIIQAANRSEQAESVVYDPNRPGDDNTELFGIREYQNTDNPKRIHWKRSSREETLFVKEYSRPMEKQYCILIDRSQPERQPVTGGQIDAQMECAHALSCILLRQQVPLVLAWNTEKSLEVQPVSTPAQLQQCMTQILEEPPLQEPISALQQLQESGFPVPYAMLFHIAHMENLPNNAASIGNIGKQLHLLTSPQAQKQESVLPISMEILPAVLTTICNA